MVVSKDNTIYLDASQLGGDDAKRVTIRWSQNLSTRQADYYVCKFQNRSEDNAEGVCFVQADKVNDLKNRSDGGENCYRVTDVFQYGQRKDGSGRFLVFHNKDSRPYQHRFIENVFSTFGGKAAEFLAGLGFSPATGMSDIARSIVGDYLKNF